MEKSKKTHPHDPEHIPWYYDNFFHYISGFILALVAILLLHQVSFLILPVFNFISSLFAPIIIAFLFYYLLRPIVYYLEDKRIPRIVSILIIYALLAILFALFIAYMIPILAKQIADIANISVEALTKLESASKVWTIGSWSFNVEQEIQKRLIEVMQLATLSASTILVDFIGIVTRVAVILIAIPFILFYLLKDDWHMSEYFLKMFTGDFALELEKILKHIDTTLSNYINSLVLISLSVGGMLFITYFMLGLNYALILSVIAIIFTTIPFIGPFLSITPALLVGLAESPFMALKVLICFVIVQQIESNIISPQIIGQKLRIHPLTIILLLLAAGTLYGLVGLILATPLYAILKVILQNLYKIYRLRYPDIKAGLTSR